MMELETNDYSVAIFDASEQDEIDVFAAVHGFAMGKPTNSLVVEDQQTIIHSSHAHSSFDVIVETPNKFSLKDFLKARF